MEIKGLPYIVDLTPPEALAWETGSLAGKGRNAAPRSFDQVDLSSSSLSLDVLKRDLDALPEVRLDRVALARQNMQEGGYPIEPALVAEKIMEAFGA